MKKLLLLPLIFFIGCATQRYTWNGYDNSLYAYYKTPAEKERFIERLKETITKAEQTGKIPPGIYAEYGYMCYEEQNYKDAIMYFQKEYDLWPEAQPFMERMIMNAKNMLVKTERKEGAL
jgi:hypothetical protein